MTDRDELRQAVKEALAVTERCYMGAQSLDDMADAAIAAYEAHKLQATSTLIRPDGSHWNIQLTREEWREAIERGTRERKERMLGKGVPIWEDDRADTEWSLRAAFPWLKVEGECKP